MADISQLRVPSFVEGLTGSLSPKVWTGDGAGSLSGRFVWTDGDNVYCSIFGTTHYVLDKETGAWNPKTWTGMSELYGTDVWTDGDNYYYSEAGENYVLNKQTGLWGTKTWQGQTNISGSNVWTDGEHIYCSNGAFNKYAQLVLDKSTDTWSSKSWNLDGLTQSSTLFGEDIWTDGENIYYSNGTTHYVLDKSTDTWTTKTWNIASFTGSYNIWTFGNDVYMSKDGANYILNKSTGNWESQTWTDADAHMNGENVWSDGENLYYSDSNQEAQQIFDVSSGEVFKNYDIKDAVARQNDASLDSRVTALEQGGGGGGGSSLLPVRAGSYLQVVNTLPTPSSMYKDRTYFLVGAPTGSRQPKMAYRCVSDDGGSTYEWRLEMINIQDTSSIQEVSSLPDPASTNLWNVKYNNKYYRRVMNYSTSTWEWVECIIEYYYLPDVESHMGLNNYPAYNATANALYPNGISISYLTSMMVKISFKRQLTANGTTKLLTNINNFLYSQTGFSIRAVGHVACGKSASVYPLNIYNSSTEYIRLYAGGNEYDTDGIYVAVDEAGFYYEDRYDPNSKGNIFIYVDLYISI